MLTVGEESSEQLSWYKPSTAGEGEQTVRRKVPTRKNADVSEFLPAIETTNVRSLGPKIASFILDFKSREISVALVSETWGKDKQHYKRKILAMFEREGLGTISLSRKTR